MAPSPESKSSSPEDGGYDEKDDGTTNKNGGEYDGKNDVIHDDKYDGEEVPEVNGVSKKWIPNSKFRKQQMNKRREKICVVFNYSKVTLIQEMENVLNRGLNFSILPLKLDLT